MTYTRRLTKPDGRYLVLYSRRMPLDQVESPPSPGPAVEASSHFRWHPFRAEWVAYAGHRQNRTFLPPEGYDPLAPTAPGAAPTELPAGPWSVAVFENRFPALTLGPGDAPSAIVDTLPGRGVCEMVVYTQEPSGGIGDLDQDDVELLIEVWAHRTLELGGIDGIRYVMPFENRGPEVGATLQHPHGQIFAYPFVPPIPARELEEQRRYLDTHGRGLLEDHLAGEVCDRQRIIFANRSAVAFVPAFGRYPYEVWVAPFDPVPSLTELTAEQRTGVAQALKRTVQCYDALRGTPFPYVMVIHQAPTDGLQHPEAHLHFEFYPPYRSPDRLKYLAGTELGAGMFINDALPEAKAAELRGTAGKESGVP